MDWATHKRRYCLPSNISKRQPEMSELREQCNWLHPARPPETVQSYNEPVVLWRGVVAMVRGEVCADEGKNCCCLGPNMPGAIDVMVLTVRPSLCTGMRTGGMLFIRRWWRLSIDESMWSCSVGADGCDVCLSSLNLLVSVVQILICLIGMTLTLDQPSHGGSYMVRADQEMS